MLASSYPLLDVFLSTLYLVFFVLWIILVFHVLWDIMRSPDMNGWIKALWVLFVFVIPLIGTLVYLIVRGGSMQERDQRLAQDQQKAFEDYIRRVAHSKGDSDTPLEPLP